MQNSTDISLSEAAVAVLRARDPLEKVRLAEEMNENWCERRYSGIGAPIAVSRPGRPPRPELLRPRDMPNRRNLQSESGRIALMHALAHIELNAIDLACDLIARFADAERSEEFYNDWCRVAAEEAEHFLLLNEALARHGAAYGDLPAHDGLWEAAADTADEILARLAVVPLVLEVRGLDVTPPMAARLRDAGDEANALVLDRIYEDEIGHVAIGFRWFDVVCREQNLDPSETWPALVAKYYKGRLKAPFNLDARDRAGIPRGYYLEPKGNPGESS